MITTGKISSHREENKQFREERLAPRIVTTSWDDGDACDLRIAEMLWIHKLPGTFYIPITGHHGSRSLRQSEIRTLDNQGFEIGAHGFSHLILPQCTKEVMIHEVETGKQRLEDILGSEVRMFAYPRGRYSGKAIRSVKRAGYAGARTTEMLAQGFHYDPYKMPTTVQVFPHPKSDHLRNAARAMDFGKAWKYFTQFWQVKSWVELAKILFDSVLAEGGVFHLYGHSWEVDELGLWDDLEEVLEYVSYRDNVRYLPNAEVLDYRTDKTYRYLEGHCALQE